VLSIAESCGAHSTALTTLTPNPLTVPRAQSVARRQTVQLSAQPDPDDAESRSPSWFRRSRVQILDVRRGSLDRVDDWTVWTGPESGHPGSGLWIVWIKFCNPQFGSELLSGSLETADPDDPTQPSPRDPSLPRKGHDRDGASRNGSVERQRRDEACLSEDPGFHRPDARWACSARIMDRRHMSVEHR
jgi:hypothetical protein